MAVRDYTVHEDGDSLYRKLTQPASGGKAGDPCLVGRRPGVLKTDQDTNGYATVRFKGSYLLRAHGVVAAGNSAIAINDDLYYDAAPGGGNPNINKDNTNGVLYGVAAGALASAANGYIVVDLV